MMTLTKSDWLNLGGATFLTGASAPFFGLAWCLCKGAAFLSWIGMILCDWSAWLLDDLHAKAVAWKEQNDDTQG